MYLCLFIRFFFILVVSKKTDLKKKRIKKSRKKKKRVSNEKVHIYNICKMNEYKIYFHCGEDTTKIKKISTNAYDKQNTPKFKSNFTY